MADDVTLDRAAVFWAAEIGVTRHLEALLAARPDAYGYDAARDGWGDHIEGACGELAVAQLLGWTWEATINTFKVGGDVGDVQVRTRSRHYYDLLIRPDARPTDCYVLVTGRCPRYRVHGWIRAGDAMRPEWLHTYGGRPPAYFGPATALSPLAALRAAAA
jgi:hypothetical protein